MCKKLCLFLKNSRMSDYLKRVSSPTVALLAAYSGWSDERIPEEREAHIEGCATGRSA